MAIRVRPLTDEEQKTITRWSRSRTEPARRVERATIIRLASEGQSVPQVAAEIGLCEAAVRKWIKQFNARGLAGLEDAPRSGAPSRYTAEVRGQMVATALTPPQQLGQPFASWTYERLATYLAEQRQVRMKKTRIFEILQEEGLRWRQQETWFGERVDPDFAKKRGPSSASAPTRPRTAPS
jgi:transposase